MKIKKQLTIRILSLVIAIVFLSSGLTYSKDIFSLRVPLQRDERRMPPELIQEISDILAHYGEHLPNEGDALRNVQRKIDIVSQYVTKNNCSLDLFSLRLMSSMLDSESKSVLRDVPLEHVEEELWGVLKRILNYDQEIKNGAPNPYQNPIAYIDFIVELMCQYWDLMKRDGRYQYLVNCGLSVCLKEHLKDVEDEIFDHPFPFSLRKGYTNDIVYMINYMYNILFETYIDELMDYEDFLHHVEGSPYYSWGMDMGASNKHREEVHLEKWREEIGIRKDLEPYKYGLEERLYALEKEAEILERCNVWIREGIIAPETLDIEDEIHASHVVYGDPILMRSYFNPFAWEFYFKPLEKTEELANLGPIKEYLEEHIQGNPSVLEIGAGCGTLGFILNGSRLKQNLTGIEWNKNYVEEAHRDERGQYVREGSTYSIFYPPQSFDVVVSFESLDVFEDQERALKEIGRVINDDGLLIHIARAESNPMVCKKLLAEEGIKVFTSSFPAPCGIREVYSYFPDIEKQEQFFRLEKELTSLESRDAQNAGIPYNRWPSFSDGGVRYSGREYRWSEETLAKYREYKTFRDKHERQIDKETYRDILIKKTKGMFTLLEEQKKDSITFYLFKKKGDNLESTRSKDASRQTGLLQQVSSHRNIEL